jgi:release factor glutamine methyltransferase
MTIEYLLRDNAYSVEIFVLLSFLLKKSKGYLLAHKEQKLSHNQLKELSYWLDELKNDKPLAYILNNKDFYKESYFVDESVLIPRPETELMVELILTNLAKNADKNKVFNILEIGTGSGCIPISIINNCLQDLKIESIDVSKSALKTARKNKKNILPSEKRPQLKFINSDIFKSIPKNKFDIVISNPPYLSEFDYLKVSKGIRNYEPKTALLAGDNGLAFYKRICGILPSILKNDGQCYLEINSRLCDEIHAIFDNWDTKIYKDHSGLLRVILITHMPYQSEQYSH